MARKSFEIFFVILLMTALAVISTYPLIKSFSTEIPWAVFRDDVSGSLLYRPGDHLQLFYFFWLVKENLLGHVPFNSNPYEFNMLDGITAGNDGMTTAPLAFINFMFSPLGDVAAYNCTLISSYVLAGLFMYLLAKMISASKAGSLLAAVMFTFVPIRIIGISGGHQFGFVLFLYPMIFYFMEKCIRTEKIIYSILAGLGIIALSYNEPHLIYYFCLCMVGYLPVRFITLLPVENDMLGYVPPFAWRNSDTWPHWFSLLTIFGSGIAIVFYVHLVFPKSGHASFWSTTFWWMIGVYPLIILFFSLTLASIYSRLCKELSFRYSLAVEVRSMMPLYILPFLSLLGSKRPGPEDILFVSIFVILGIKLWVLKARILNMLSQAYTHAVTMKKRLLVFSPVLLGMVTIVLLNIMVRAKKIAPSTESGGRTLSDVRSYSAHLQDLFISTSTIYTGILPVIIVAIFMCYLLWLSGRGDTIKTKSVQELPLYYLLVFGLLVSQVLATGLAMGNRSLYILFYNYVPYFNTPRVSDRILCVTVFLMACITAGVANKFIKLMRSKYWLATCTVIFILLTGYQLKSYSLTSPMAMTDLPSQIEKGYQYIKDNIGDGLLLELPLWPGDSHQSSVYQYFATRDKVRRVNGYTPLVSKEYFNNVFKPLHSLNRGMLDKKQYDYLRRLNVRFISVHEHIDYFTPKVSPNPPNTTVRWLINSPFLEYEGAWEIYNRKYAKVHEYLYIFKVKEDAIEGEDIKTHYSMPAFFSVGGRLQSQTGKVVFDDNLGREIYNALPGRDAPGFLVFGPYSVFFPGNYRSCFRIKINGEEGVKAGNIEVARSIDKKSNIEVLAGTDLEKKSSVASFQDYCVDFELKEWSRLELRVFYTGTNELSLDRIKVIETEDQAKPMFFEAEMMPGETGRTVRAKDASGQKIIEAIPGRDKAGKMIYGPYMKYGPGDYSAIFHLKSEGEKSAGKKKNNNVAVLAVTGYPEQDVFVQRMVKTADIYGDSFKEISLEFTLDEPQEIGLEVRFLDNFALQVDGVQVLEKR